jgi:hypothetical protein
MATQRLAPLERLPAELLRPIFVESGNANLALSSDIIGAKLSNSEFLYRTMAANRLLGYEDWVDWYLNTNQSANEKARSAVSKLLAAKFMTWDRFKQYMRLASKRPSSIDNLLLVSLYHEGIAPFGVWRNIKNIPTRKCLHDMRTIAYIPIKLLQEPFSPEKSEFLHFLLRNNLEFHESHKLILAANRDAIFANADEVLSACLKSKALNFLQLEPTWAVWLFGHLSWFGTREPVVFGPGRPVIPSPLWEDHLRMAQGEGWLRR